MQYNHLTEEILLVAVSNRVTYSLMSLVAYSQDNMNASFQNQIPRQREIIGLQYVPLSFRAT